MRRTLILFILLAITGAIVWWFVARLKEEPHEADPWTAMPVDAAVIVDVPSPLASWQRFVNTSQFWSEWSALPGCNAFDTLMRDLSEATANDPVLSAALARSRALLFLTNDGGKLGMITAWPMQLNSAVLSKLAPALQIDPAAGDRLLNGQAVAVQREHLPDIHVTYRDDMLIAASSEAALNDALAHLDAGSAGMDEGLLRVRRSAGASADLHIYVNVQRTGRLFSNWIAQEALEGITGAQGWIAMDGELRADALMMSGWMENSAVPPRLRSLHGSTGANLYAPSVLPPAVHTFREYNAGDIQAFSTAMRGSPPADSMAGRWLSWCGGTITAAQAGKPSDSSLVHWAVVRATDPIRATATLDAVCTGTCDSSRYRGVRISKLPKGAGPGDVFGDAGFDLDGAWWCALNDAIVLSDRPGGMRSAIDAFTDGASLASADGPFFERTAGISVLSWFGHLGRGMSMLEEAGTDQGRTLVHEEQASLRSIGGCSLQLTPASDGGWFVNLCLGKAATTTVPGERSSLWVVNVGTPLIMGPSLVTDHLSRTKQVLVQDEKDRIALISCTGKLIWQRELDGPIMGEVHQVDRFKNGKLQMLFNTPTRIYLVDRNGKDVDGFPVSLPEKASAPLSVFDYENKKEYRVLVPTEEARLLNYGIDGKPVHGWTPPRTPATCDVPVEHVRLRGKDHLILADRSGHVTVLDRRGETRYAPKLEAKNTEHLIGLAPAMDLEDLSLLWSDPNGNMLSGKLSGAIDTLHTTEGVPVRTILTEPAGKDQPKEAAIVIKGVRLYPDAAPIANGASRAAVADINLDGSKERVVATSDGRVLVEPLRP
jgi:hypothetical protein